MTNVVFLAKTDLNTDGRILNQIQILEKSNLNIKIDFILFPDKPLKINPGKNVNIYSIETTIRNSKLLRLFTVIEFTIRTLFRLFKLKPSTIHAHDTAVVPPVLIYRFFKGRKFKLIYDDHEIPNENASLFNKFFHFLEVQLMKNADYIIFANKERMDLIKQKHTLSTKSTYFLNLPYFDSEEKTPTLIDEELELLDQEILNGIKFIIHQGVIVKERGMEKLATFSQILPDGYKILLLGGNKKGFTDFVQQYNLNIDKFYFVGSVSYLVLPQYWKKGIASIVMYLPTFINNRLCAPNRFYLSLSKGLPVIVNKDNPVLSNFINEYQCGLFIEDINTENVSEKTQKLSIDDEIFLKLREEQINNFIETYQTILI